MKTTPVYDKNLKAYKDGHRLIINKGGTRSSKSFSILQVHLTIANEAKTHKKTSLVSQSFPHLRDGLVYDFERILKEVDINPDLIHNQGKHFFQIGNSTINYFSADKGDKVTGPSRNILHLNEPNKGVSFEAYTQLKTRTEEAIWIDYNPSGPFWLQSEGLLDSERSIVIHSTFLDNINNLTRAQIDDFKENYRKSLISSYWNYWWKVYGKGEDAVLSEERIMPFLHSCSMAQIPADAYEIPAGVDFGFFPDPTTYIRLWIRKRRSDKELDRLYVKQCVYDHRLSINAASPEVRNFVDVIKDRGGDINHRIIAESAEPRNISDMRMAGFTIEAVKKTAVEESIKLFHDYEIWIVDPEKSQETVNEMNNYKYHRDPKTNAILGIPAPKQPDHAIDAIRYVLLSRNYRWT